MKPVLTALLAAAVGAAAVSPDITSPWSRVPAKPDASQGATVSQVFGTNTWAQVTYHRPGVRDRDVWNDTSERGAPIVPRDGEPGPWRAGANECTTFEVSADVKVESLDLPKGKYALFMIPRDDRWTIIFNSDHEQWGASKYDESKDVLRIDVKPESAPFNEWLQYGFDFAEENWTRCYMHWGKVKVAFEVGVLPKRG